MVYELERKTLDKTILKTIKQLLNKKKQEFSSSILCIFLLHQKLVIFNKVYRLVPFFPKIRRYIRGDESTREYVLQCHQNMLF